MKTVELKHRIRIKTHRGGGSGRGDGPGWDGSQLWGQERERADSKARNDLLLTPGSTTSCQETPCKSFDLSEAPSPYVTCDTKTNLPLTDLQPGLPTPRGPLWLRLLLGSAGPGGIPGTQRGAHPQPEPHGASPTP